MLQEDKINMMIMAGTKDAANIIMELKSSNNFKILATTTTEYGAAIAKDSGADEVLSGLLDQQDLINLIKKRKIQILIDATHPFATAATKNAINSSEEAKIKYIRFERPEKNIIKSNYIHKVLSFEEAALKANELTEGKILHLAGVSTLKPVIEKIDSKRLFVRVLPSLDSIQKCLDLGLKQENIIAMQGTFSKNFNKRLMEEYEISLIITKESGETSGTPSKINAALELEIDVVLVNRPEITELNDKNVFTNLDKMVRFILKSC